MERLSFIRLHPNDDVIVATRDLPPGFRFEPDELVARDPIPSGHKIAVRAIRKGEAVRRYNQIIGFAKGDIEEGRHVHVHNLGMGMIDKDYEFCVDAIVPPPAKELRTFQGYRRPNGKAATRNYIGIIASVNCSATVVRAIANHFTPDRMAPYANIDGVVPLTHPTGCGMNAGGEDMIVLQRTMRGFKRHPNFAGIVFIGLGCELNQISYFLDDEPACEPDMLQTVNIQEIGGSSNAIRKGIELVSAMLNRANAYKRIAIPVSELIVGLNCGGSDGYSGITANPALGGAADLLVAHGGTVILSETPEIYGAEHLLTRRAATRQVGEKLLERIAWWENYVKVTGGEMDNNPSVGNKAGGLTTILEKSLGAVAKCGSTSLNAVYEYAERIEEKGFVYMDTPGYDPVSVTGQAAGGAQVICFTTGRGSALGCAGVPTIKLATNTALWDRQRDDLDVNCGDIIDGVPMATVSQRIFDAIIAHASGDKTRSEALGYGNDEFLPWKIGAVM